MPKSKLTDRTILAAKPRVGHRTELHDDKVSGLVLRITENGRRSWSLVYRRRSDGKKRRVTLGPYPSVSLADARRRGHDLIAAVWEGRDPVEEAKAVRRRMPFGELAALYLDRHVRRKLRSATQYERRLNHYVLPEWKDRPAEDIGRTDVILLVERIAADGKGTLANRMLQLISSLFGWAVSEGLLPQSPVTGIRPRTDERPRERFLEQHEIKVLCDALDRGVIMERSADVLRLCLLTGQRVGELGGLRTAEIDQHSWVWNLPSQRSKNGVAHAVPLVGRSKQIIEKWMSRAEENGRSVLFQTLRGCPIDASTIGHALDNARKEIGLAHFTTHDLRRSVATHMARIGIDRLTIGSVLNHVSTTKAGITGSVYDRHDRLEEKRRALSAWDSEIQRIVSGLPGASNVIALAQGAQP